MLGASGGRRVPRSGCRVPETRTDWPGIEWLAPRAREPGTPNPDPDHAMLFAPRHLSRLRATIGLFTRYGLADFAKQQGLHGLGVEPEEMEEANGGGVAEKAVAFRHRLVELGPAYVKLGQVLSTRPDLLPP